MDSFRDRPESVADATMFVNVHLLIKNAGLAAPTRASDIPDGAPTVFACLPFRADGSMYDWIRALKFRTVEDTEKNTAFREVANGVLDAVRRRVPLARSWAPANLLVATNPDKSEDKVLFYAWHGWAPTREGVFGRKSV